MIDTRPQTVTGADRQTPLQQFSDFSLVAGGPLYRLCGARGCLAMLWRCCPAG